MLKTQHQHDVKSTQRKWVYTDTLHITILVSVTYSWRTDSNFNMDFSR